MEFFAQNGYETSLKYRGMVFYWVHYNFRLVKQIVKLLHRLVYELRLRPFGKLGR